MSELVEQSSEDAICQDGKWFVKIPKEQACAMRTDVQLYRKIKETCAITIDLSPKAYREGVGPENVAADSNPRSWWWRDHSYYIQVDSPDKEEYEPSA